MGKEKMIRISNCAGSAADARLAAKNPPQPAAPQSIIPFRVGRAQAARLAEMLAPPRHGLLADGSQPKDRKRKVIHLRTS